MCFVNLVHEIVPDFVFIPRRFQNNSPNEHLLTALTVWLDFGLMQQGSSLMQVYNIKPLFYLGGETVLIKAILVKSYYCQISWKIICDLALLNLVGHVRVHDFLELFWVALIVKSRALDGATLQFWTFFQRLQHTTIEFPLKKQSENPWVHC